MNKSLFAKNLSFIMKKLEFRDKSVFARFLDIPVPTVTRWMNSVINPSINQQHKEKILKKLGVKIDILLYQSLEHETGLHINRKQNGDVFLEIQNKETFNDIQIYIELLTTLKNNNCLKSVTVSEFVKFMSKD